MKLKLKKILITFVVVLNIFSLALPAYGMDTFALGNPTGSMDSILGSLGIDKEQLKNNIKTANVASMKISPPMVSLTFDPTDPVPGEKVTVTAMPTYFMNTTEKLYFTWYLKNDRCYDRKLDGDSKYEDFKKTDDFAKCDLNDTGEVDIEDYKIKATRLLVNNDFVWQPEDTVYASDSDNDGYEAVFGGDDQRGKNAYCFIHDVASGSDYQLDECKHLFPNAKSDETGDGDFGASEEKFWHTNPKNADTASTGNTDEANVTGLGENVFTFPYTTGDKIGVAIEGISVQATQEADSSYRTMWAFTKNECDPTNEGEDTGYPKTTTNTVAQVDTPSVGYTTTTTTTTSQTILSQVNDSATIRSATTTTVVVSYIDPSTGLPDPGIPDTTTSTTTSTCPASSLEGDGTVGCSGVDQDITITMTDMDSDDLNNCLYQNLVTPTEGGGATEKLDTNLAYLPQNPLNDTSGNKNGDLLSFTASVTNATNPDYLNYTWEVYESDEANPDDWGQALSKDSLDEATQMTGLGMDEFNFKLNFADPKKYLKITVTAKDTLNDDSGEREGHTNVVVPIFSSEEKIKVYSAKTTFNTGTTDPNISLPDNPQEICLFTDPTTGIQTPQSTCEVVKDEIIALEIDNADNKYSEFLWTIDGKTNTCQDSSFSSCLGSTGEATARTYFPILKNSGDQYSVNLSALDSKTGERISLTRVFEVITPEVKIVPKEKDASGNYICRGLLLGQYVDFNGTAFDDRSDSNFQALTSTNLELVPVFSGAEGPKILDAADAYPYKWTVDGIAITAENATTYGYSIDLSDYGKLILPPKETGEAYSVSFSSVYTPTNAAKKTLNKYWNITYNEFYEKRLSDEISVEMVDTEIAQKDNSPRKIFATVSSGIPSYLAFLFRIILSGVAIILAVKIIFSILPKTKTDEF